MPWVRQHVNEAPKHPHQHTASTSSVTRQEIVVSFVVCAIPALGDFTGPIWQQFVEKEA